MATLEHPSVSPLRWRLAAVGCVVLVLLLAALSASPALHRVLHVDSDAADHTCAVVLFASGVTLAAAAIAVVAPRASWITAELSPPAEIRPPACRYLRQPERGPPGG